jgi:molybdopterin converting factor small subunit
MGVQKLTFRHHACRKLRACHPAKHRDVPAQIAESLRHDYHHILRELVHETRLAVS